MTDINIRPAVNYGTQWTNRDGHNLVAAVNNINDGGTVELMTSEPSLVTLTVDELHEKWESTTVLTPVGSKWTTDLVYMPSVVVQVNHWTGECLRRDIYDPDDECWDDCWKVHDLFRRIGGGR